MVLARGEITLQSTFHGPLAYLLHWSGLSREDKDIYIHLGSTTRRDAHCNLTALRLHLPTKAAVVTRAREDRRRRSGPGLVASTWPRAARNMGLCAAHAVCVANRVGRAPEDAELCLRDGRRLHDVGAGGPRCGDAGRRGRRRINKRCGPWMYQRLRAS
ncbi:hypothetical protein EI94DRAFT_1754322 [Lactarius quietus]|nr:hypothetical protein EI94DRAFT_1754322 [Lactarius quietus]